MSVRSSKPATSDQMLGSKSSDTCLDILLD
jgi:hypothetical protein